ncbi:hypothetical protein DCC79_05775 [bacterium]|nr:MAG: hypothetical protein DCC79_05775 [bacterium]
MSNRAPVVIRVSTLAWALAFVALVAGAIAVGYRVGRGPGAGGSVPGAPLEAVAPAAGVPGTPGAAGAPGRPAATVPADLGALAALATQGAAPAPRAMPVVPAGPTLDLGGPLPDFGSAPQTEELLFQPALPEGEPRGGGVCEQESALAPRADAWHCLESNQPYDPCYSVPGDDGLVICGARPGFESAGFLLRLVSPLPDNRAVAPRDEPWILGLADTTCEIILGMGLADAITFGAKPLRYGCRDGTYLVDVVRDRPTWAAQRVTLRFEGERPEIDSAAWEPVAKAWR